MGSTGLEFVNAWAAEGLRRLKTGERISSIVDDQARTESIQRVIDKVYDEHAQRCTFAPGVRERLYRLAYSMPEGTAPWYWAQILGTELEAHELSCSEWPDGKPPADRVVHGHRLIRELLD